MFSGRSSHISACNVSYFIVLKQTSSSHHPQNAKYVVQKHVEKSGLHHGTTHPENQKITRSNKKRKIIIVKIYKVNICNYFRLFLLEFMWCMMYFWCQITSNTMYILFRNAVFMYLWIKILMFHDQYEKVRFMFCRKVMFFFYHTFILVGKNSFFFVRLAKTIQVTCLWATNVCFKKQLRDFVFYMYVFLKGKTNVT